MPKYGVYLKAHLENVTVKSPAGMFWVFKMLDKNGEPYKNDIHVSTTEEYDNPVGKGTINLILGGKGGKKSTVKILSEDGEYGEDDIGEWKLMASFECRGCTPEEWIVEGLVAEGPNETMEIEFDEGDWYDYDEREDMTLSVTEYKSKIERI